MDNLIELLDYIDPAACTYEEWVEIGMALKHEGFSAADWDAWSARDPGRFRAGDCEKKWQSFAGSASPVTGGTIVQMAKEHGWTPARSACDEPLDWDSWIGGSGEDYRVVDQGWIEGRELNIPERWEPARQLITYLETLFEPSETIGFVTETWEKDGKFLPSKGTYTRTAGEVIELLSKNPQDLGAAIGDYNPEAGAWIRFNPLDGNGVKNENVTEYRYALVESDTMDLAHQNAILRELELPIACLVYSGGKSLHAIVRIEAADYPEYKKRVEFLYEICQKNGLEIDRQNKNPSRLSRMPGVIRKGEKQYLLDTNIGKASWSEWREWIEGVNDDLPDIESYADVYNNLPELSPILIDGVLRQGHKMLLAGPAKAGKSFALIELAVAIASGRKWLGFQCAKGKVLYINFEIDNASYLHRIDDVCHKLMIPQGDFQNLDFWSLRGQSVPMDKLTPKLIRRAEKKNYIAIIIDPIYKVITGDENSAEEMAKFCNQFDKISHALGCAVIYCHHHSKGAQGWKTAMDRASGSGVFARDPDALIDMLELAIPGAALNEDDEIVEKRSAWRIEGTLREFPSFKPRNVYYEWPVHLLDTRGELDDAYPKGSKESNVVGKGKASGTPEERSAARYRNLCQAFEKAKDSETGMAKLADIAEQTNPPVKPGTLSKWIRNEFNDEFVQIEKAGVYARRDDA